MPDYTLYDSKRELRERLSDLDDLLEDYGKTQQVLDEQRGALIDRVQGAVAIYEKQRDDLERRQKELATQREEALKNREALQHQLDAKLGKSSGDDASPKAGASDQGVEAERGDGLSGPTTREQIDKLKSQLSKPQTALDLDPPGMAGSQASQVDKDLKLMAKIKAKEQRMDNASQNLREGWNQAKGVKP